MLELASLGAKVLQVRSVELGMVHNMPIFVRSSFDKPEDIDPHANQPPGTLICGEEEIMESHVVTGIAFSKDEAQISVRQIEDKPGVAAAIFGPLADANINVDMIVQNVSEDGKTTDLTFTVPATDYNRARETITSAKAKIGFARLDTATDVAKVSVIGIGHAQPCGRRRQGVRGARRAQHQHPRHHHLRDQVFGADRRRLHGTCGAHAAYALRAGPGLENFSWHAPHATAWRQRGFSCAGQHRKPLTPPAGRRFAWQNKPQFAIGRAGRAAANCAPVMVDLIRAASEACDGAE